MAKPTNRIVRNRPSPKNEKEYIEAYKQKNPSSHKKDDKDISAVKTLDGTRGHALLKQEHNRSQDKQPHRGVAFVPDAELKKIIKGKK